MQIDPESFPTNFDEQNLAEFLLRLVQENSSQIERFLSRFLPFLVQHHHESFIDKIVTSLVHVLENLQKSLDNVMRRHTGLFLDWIVRLTQKWIIKPYCS